MNPYKPSHIRWANIIAFFVRCLSGLLRRWPLLLLAIFIISPVGPHLRFQYTYEQRGTYRALYNCEYVGSRGFVNYRVGGECPIFTIIDRRKYR